MLWWSQWLFTVSFVHFLCFYECFSDLLFFLCGIIIISFETLNLRNLIIFRIWWYKQCFSRQVMWYPSERHPSTRIHYIIYPRGTTTCWQAATKRLQSGTQRFLSSCLWLAEESSTSVACLRKWGAHGWTCRIFCICCCISEYLFSTSWYIWCLQVCSWISESDVNDSLEQACQKGPAAGQNCRLVRHP